MQRIDERPRPVRTVAFGDEQEHVARLTGADVNDDVLGAGRQIDEGCAAVQPVAQPRRAEVAMRGDARRGPRPSGGVARLEVLPDERDGVVLRRRDGVVRERRRARAREDDGQHGARPGAAG